MSEREFERASGRLRALREAHGRSLASMTGPTGKDAPALSRLERGQARLTVGVLHVYARELGLKSLAKALEPFLGESG